MKATVLFLITVVALVLYGSQTAWSMSSANYAMEWYLPLTGGGSGEQAVSTNYGVEVTYGQTARGLATDTNSAVELGYWYGILGLEKKFPWALFIPAAIGAGHEKSGN